MGTFTTQQCVIDWCVRIICRLVYADKKHNSPIRSSLAAKAPLLSGVSYLKASDVSDQVETEVQPAFGSIDHR